MPWNCRNLGNLICSLTVEEEGGLICVRSSGVQREPCPWELGLESPVGSASGAGAIHTLKGSSTEEAVPGLGQAQHIRRGV